MKSILKRPIKPLYGGILVVSGLFIIVAIYILLFDPELWDPLQIYSLSLLLYLFVLAHRVPDEDAKKKNLEER